MRRPMQEHDALERELKELVLFEEKGVDPTGKWSKMDKKAIKARVRMIKNRLAAKRSREHARTYVQELEGTLEALQSKNEALARRLAAVEAENEKLKKIGGLTAEGAGGVVEEETKDRTTALVDGDFIAEGLPSNCATTPAHDSSGGCMSSSATTEHVVDTMPALEWAEESKHEEMEDEGNAPVTIASSSPVTVPSSPGRVAAEDGNVGIVLPSYDLGMCEATNSEVDDAFGSFDKGGANYFSFDDMVCAPEWASEAGGDEGMMCAL